VTNIIPISTYEVRACEKRVDIKAMVASPKKDRLSTPIPEAGNLAIKYITSKKREKAKL
jgi:hypothetical protein